MLRDVVTPHAVDVARQRAPPSTIEDPPLRRYKLIQHTVIVGVDSLEEVNKVIKEHDLVFFPEGLEERFVPLVCSYIQQTSVLDFSAIFYEILGGQPSLFVLEV